MLQEFDPSLSETFIQVARRRGLLTEEQARTLREVSTEKSVMSSQVAVELGLLEPLEVEIALAFTAPQDLAPGYELLDVLGYGALGVVYRARQAQLQRDVAIKSIMQSRLAQQNVLARFQQEGAAIGRLQHPNIVSAYDFGSHRSRFYLVMELVKGSDLRGRLDRGPIGVSTALSIVRQTASGLAHALAHQIIHRDIKPGNLILTEAPAGFDLPRGVPLVKIADFGLARLASPADAEQATRLTLEGAAIGTPMYCAPEQLTADPIDHRADIYGLGATFFRMLTGQEPFVADTVSKIIAVKVTGQQPRWDLLPDETDPRVRQLLADMMQHDPEQRIPDYETLIARIDQIQQPTERVIEGNLPLRPLPAGDEPKTKRWPGKRVLVSAIAIMILGVAALLAPRTLFRGSSEPTMVPNGWEMHLFDGKTVTGWTDRVGLWHSGTDAEGGAILVGKGSAVRTLPEPEAVRGEKPTGIGFRIGIDLQQASAAELHFGSSREGTGDPARQVVRLSRQHVTLGISDAVGGDFVKSSQPMDVSNVSGDGPNYHELRVELQGGYWFVFFDGQLVGDSRADRSANNRQIQLVARGGSVHFEGPTAYGLKVETTGAP